MFALLVDSFAGPVYSGTKVPSGSLLFRSLKDDLPDIGSVDRAVGTWSFKSFFLSFLAALYFNDRPDTLCASRRLNAATGEDESWGM